MSSIKKELIPKCRYASIRHARTQKLKEFCASAFRCGEPTEQDHIGKVLHNRRDASHSERAVTGARRPDGSGLRRRPPDPALRAGRPLYFLGAARRLELPRRIFPIVCTKATFSMRRRPPAVFSWTPRTIDRWC